MTFINNVLRVNYYEKCYEILHIYISINQPKLISLNNDLNLVLSEKGKVSGDIFSIKWRLGILRKC